MEKSFQYTSRALSQTPSGHPDLPSRLTSLGISHHDRYNRFGELDDVNRSIEHTSHALALTPNDNPDLPHQLTQLGKFYNDRFQGLGELRDLEKAIECASRALALTPDGHPHLPLRLIQLGKSHNDRFQRLGELVDLEKAVEYTSRAVALTPDGHPDLLHQLVQLGKSYNNRFQRLGDLEDLEKAIEYVAHALRLSPGDHPELLHQLTQLGKSYSDRFQRLGELDDLQKAIECASRALALTPDGHPHLPLRLIQLGKSHNDRFQRLGELTDLEKAIEYTSRALNLTPDGHPELPHQLSQLGKSHNDRFQRLGELEDLEKAVKYTSRAVELTPDDYPDLPHQLTQLGKSYNDQFHRFRELRDLEKAIECASRALALTPDGHPHLPLRLIQLGKSHNDRFQRLGELTDLEKAIEYTSRALNLTPDGHPELPHQLSQLGKSHNDRFQRLGELEDLEKAVKYTSRAAELTPYGHPDLLHQLTQLGKSYSDRFQQLGELEDLEKAIEYASRALALTPDGHPSLPTQHFHLAKSFFLQFQHTNELSHLQESLWFFRNAAGSQMGEPRDKFVYALHWANLASKHSSLNPIEAFQAAIDLLPQFIWMGTTTRQQYEDLSEAEGLAIQAASVAIHSSNYPLALEWLEQARCVVWNQSLMLRYPVDELHIHHPALATRLQTVIAQLDSARSQSHFRAPSAGLMTSEQIAWEHRRLAMEYDNLLSQVRTLPGFEHFLQPLKASVLVHAARNGPIVVIICGEDHCDALLILSGRYDIQHLPLPNFAKENAQEAHSEIEIMLEGREPGDGSGIENALTVLWNGIVKPVLDFLGYTNTAPMGRLPHITWCPTGVLSFLPLHAAGDYNEPQSRAFDYVISSYTPTLTALLATTPSTLNYNTRVLAIGQQATPGRKPLFSMVRELESVKAHVVKNNVQYSQLIDSKATTKTVLDAMEQHDWVHFACHTHKNVHNPAESGFILHEGILDLAAISRRSFKSKGLAYLSACHTAVGYERLPDEAIHLAAGMLIVGYPSVIAALWSLFDEDPPFLAERVYAKLVESGKVGNGEGGEALHYAIAALRQKVGEKAFAHWVPYIHIGS
ncbi:unnamed protein product [Rhizoctonia solani]|uniref:CHAT domain-containing protein n=1 Tax=Rhizoctonia solani TaxID=456999 RepID=A0A8H3DKY6_9AGAM|nr:unnamed protein product [Rhizoctonia solani]